mmetsp:Transcript_14589/g.22090  ORF Transcript_14589/g.22090 Transcript_14589/m.22090 type:complete len:274 (-) Transcript_14589:228-1049(-)
MGSSRIEVSYGGVQPLTVRGTHDWFVEWCSEGVKGDVNRVGVGADHEDVSHDLGSFTSKLLDVLVEVLDPVLDEGTLDDLNLHLLNDVADFSAHGVGGFLEEHCKVWSYGCIDEYRLVEVGESLGIGFKGWDGAHGGFLEHSEWVALGEEFVDVAAGECSLEEEHDVLNHVFVGDEVEEGSEGLNCLCADIFELGYELINSSTLKTGRSQNSQIRNSIGIIRLGHVKLDILERLALGNVMVVRVRKEAGAHTTDQRLDESVVDIEVGHTAVCS